MIKRDAMARVFKQEKIKIKQDIGCPPPLISTWINHTSRGNRISGYILCLKEENATEEESSTISRGKKA